MARNSTNWGAIVAAANAFNRAEAAEHAAIKANHSAYRDRTGLAPVSREPKSIHSPSSKPLQRFEPPTPGYARSRKRFGQR